MKKVRTALRRLLIVAAASALVACGGDDDGAADAPTGSVSAGEAAVATRICGSCHTGTAGLLAGQNAGTNGPNITPDKDTGIGSWTTKQIVTALLTGVDDEGETLCTIMPKYGTMGMTESEANDIAAYLKNIPAVSNTAGEPVGCD